MFAIQKSISDLTTVITNKVSGEKFKDFIYIMFWKYDNSEQRDTAENRNYNMKYEDFLMLVDIILSHPLI